MFPYYLRIKKYLKSSLKHPLGNWGLISIILFLILVFSLGFILTFPTKQKPLSVFDLKFFSTREFQSPFLDPTKKIEPEGPDFLLVEENSLKATLPPLLISPQVLGTLVEGYEIKDSKKMVTEYMVESGDNLWNIAEKFNISLNTVLWANDLNKNSIIQPGQKLVILPVSGIIHHVEAGDTISEIAQKYKGKVKEIISFNELSFSGDIYVGDIIIVPKGVMPPLHKKYTLAKIPLAKSYFICPISPPCKITQGLHWYNAVDLSHGKCGEPIFAAAGGKVLKVKLTNSTSPSAFKGAGNHLTILHPNGVVTMYGHILTSFVSPGQKVSQGQIIARIGGRPGTPGAGKSTGCHLHFGVRGAHNPLAW